MQPEPNRNRLNDGAQLRNWIQPSGAHDAPFSAERGRYHLYISLASPFSCKALMALYLKKLEDFIGVSITHCVLQQTRPNDPGDEHMGWVFVNPEKTPMLPGPNGMGSYPTAGATTDPANGAASIRDLYEICFEGKIPYSVPVLWDKKTRQIVSNESGDIVRMLNYAFDALLTVPSIDLYPEEVHDNVDKMLSWIDNEMTENIIRLSKAYTQQVYEAAVRDLYKSLNHLETHLGHHRHLCGSFLTEADLSLFVFLIRFDEVYYVLLQANRRRIEDFPNLRNVSIIL
uniref:Glutathione Stransferase omegalike protein putative n=1 Tax=Albugo laibachii Nc14 TaxID=890382 RepID=F0W3J5_9STRA|nr:glutathione Stransferase omegalike protein putative [Albugo laibachii Nc14]CCA16300.1 glutathione Stransferase omegalike protein putative [Albugo laibachii Nc14]|eukprot:CCA16300.1 glutathione Stransferase omegalike protein putative [Albugo laibachii Nc14]